MRLAVASSPARLRIILLAGAAWFLASSYFFFARKGMTTGAIVFHLAGGLFVFLALRRRRRGPR
jgi:hypothetical protein